IYKNSVKGPNGEKEMRVLWTQVNMERVPMPPPLGSQFMLAWTVQPAGLHFDPPAKICIPNMGAPAGQQVEVFSFDHDVAEFVAVGTATVTADGGQMCSDPGFGVMKSGWGGCVPPPPPCPSPRPPCSGKPADTECATYQTVPPSGPCDCPSYVRIPKSGPCNDGDDCTKDDKCQGGECKGTKIDLDPPVEVTLGGFDPPAPGVDKINKALEELKKIGIIASVNVLQVTLKGTSKPCCEDNVRGEEVSMSAAGDFGGFKVKGKIWPPGPIPTFGPKTIDIFGLAELTAEAEFVGGVFVGLTGNVSGEIGRKKNDCSKNPADKAGCTFGELKTSIGVSLSAEVGGSGKLEFDCLFCTKTTIQISASFVVGELAWSLDISNVSYNKASCSSGLAGGLLKFNPGSFKISAKFSGSYEVEDAGKRSVDVSIDFLSCEIALSGVTCN
ncbi:MAG: hypothetical protein JNL97_14650, partial [Verrucomicrobiales bacterium]|nr:hypothetical protein [Verrucomicrobiales bacterium]